MKIKNLLTGNVTKEQFSPIFLSIMYTMIFGWALARLSFNDNEKGKYCIDNGFFISKQGSLLDNPLGWWLFMVSTIVLGLGLCFYVIYLFRLFQSTSPFLSKLFLVLGVVGGLGLAMVGSNPVGSRIMIFHGIGSGMAFVGLGCAGGLALLLCYIRVLRKNPWPSPANYYTVLAMVLQFGALMYFTQEKSTLQWTGFLATFTWIVGIFIIIPQELPKPVPVQIEDSLPS
jgi:hypothetical protein